ncbi:MAG TPA: hypothetical protein VFG45_00405 [Candidatus Nitrosocosmicus sp.]|nr:hypothetical protein [Candidatus Nitrosocosmicus sp.]
MFKKTKKVWTKKRIMLIILVSISYATWFDFLDSIAYCPASNIPINCLSIGEVFGGNHLYQPWNIIGHFIPALFMFFLKPLKIEYFIAVFLLSTVVMDSPIWGIERLLHGNLLWAEDHIPTTSIVEWIKYYYNPIGMYGVWDHDWIFENFPSAAVIFWSLVIRIAVVIPLIYVEKKSNKE